MSKRDVGKVYLVIGRDYDNIERVCGSRDIAESWQKVIDDRTYIEEYDIEFYHATSDTIWEVTFEHFSVYTTVSRFATQYEHARFDELVLRRDGQGTLNLRHQDEKELQKKLAFYLSKFTTLRRALFSADDIIEVNYGGRSTITITREVPTTMLVHNVMPLED